MAQNKKEEEINYLNQFLNTPIGKNWYQIYKIKDRIEEEHPDFIFITQDNKKIGLETTQFIKNTEQGYALQSLMRIGNKICKQIQDKHGLQISIVIDKFDKRKYGTKTREEFLESVYNPGFTALFNKKEKEIKSKIEQIVDKNLEKLKNFPRLIKETIEVNSELLTFSISGFSNINNKFDCRVNNQSFSKEDSFKELQDEINKKNEKLDNYIKQCDECFLLIYNPDSSKGNYCHFTDELNKQKFSYRFSNVFFYDEDSKAAICLKKNKY